MATLAESLVAWQWPDGGWNCDREATGEPVHPSWRALHYPPSWHYDVLQGLLVLSRLGLARDPRCGEALDLLERRRLGDGRGRSGGAWWSRPGSARPQR